LLPELAHLLAQRSPSKTPEGVAVNAREVALHRYQNDCRLP
jgi:hypothetical protein